MDHRNMYKTRSRVDAAFLRIDLRKRQQALRMNQRQENLQNHRNINATISPFSRTPIKRVYATKPQVERMTRLQKFRRENGKRHTKRPRSPFISVVPSGRILPPKRDIVAERMRPFYIRAHLNRQDEVHPNTAAKTPNRSKSVLNAEKTSTKGNHRMVQENEVSSDEVIGRENEWKNQAEKPCNTGYYYFTENDGAVGGKMEQANEIGGFPINHHQFTFTLSTTVKNKEPHVIEGVKIFEKKNETTNEEEMNASTSHNKSRIPKLRRFVAINNESMNVSKSLNDTDQLNSRMKREIVDHHYSVLNSETSRLEIEVERWTDYKSDTLHESVNELIDTVIRQTNALLREKFSKFRELIALFEEGSSEIGTVELEGYWCVTNIEIQRLDQCYKKLEQKRTNNWLDLVPKSIRKATPKQKESTILKNLIEKMRQNQIAPDDDNAARQSKLRTPKTLPQLKKNISSEVHSAPKAIHKTVDSNKARLPKSILFAVADTPEVVPKRRAIPKTPRPLNSKLTANENENIDTPPNFDTSKVAISRECLAPGVDSGNKYLTSTPFSRVKDRSSFVFDEFFD